MHEEDLRLIKTIDESGAGEKIKSNEMVAAPNLAGIPKEQREEMFARYDDGFNCLKFRRFALEANNICHHTLRRSRGSYITPQTFEERETEADKLVPYMLKSKKQDAELEKAEYEEAISYLQESISKESREKAESGQVGHFYGSGLFVKVKSSEYRYDFVQARDWDTFEAETKNKITFLTAWRDFLVAVIAMYCLKLKERENPETIRAILKESKELTNEHKHLRVRVKKTLEKPIETLTPKDAKTFISCRDRMQTIESELLTLEQRFDSYQTAPEIEFPSLANEFTSDRISGNCYGDSNRSASVKAFENRYREIQDKEAASKA